MIAPNTMRTELRTVSCVNEIMKIKENAMVCGQRYKEREREREPKEKKTAWSNASHRYDKGAQVLQMCLDG